MAFQTTTRARKPAKPSAGGWGASKPKAKPRSRSSRSSGTKRGVSVTHSCGHKQQHTLKGPTWQKDRDKIKLAERVCTACWAEEQADTLEATCDLGELPELSGTVAQVLYARSIRALVIARVRGDAAQMDKERVAKGLDRAAEKYLAAALPCILKQTRSRWWLDNKDDQEQLLDMLLDFDTQDTLAALKREATMVPDCPF